MLNSTYISDPKWHKKPQIRYNSGKKVVKTGFVVERKGFEPSKRFWRLHTFQACSFDHSDTSLGGCKDSEWGP